MVGVKWLGCLGLGQKQLADNNFKQEKDAARQLRLDAEVDRCCRTLFLNSKDSG
jgi:hypothetical protein